VKAKEIAPVKTLRLQGIECLRMGVMLDCTRSSLPRKVYSDRYFGDLRYRGASDNRTRLVLRLLQ
jgi:hypothetical protein